MSAAVDAPERIEVALPHGAIGVYLVVPPDLDFEEWEKVGRAIEAQGAAAPWLIGDWVLAAPRTRGRLEAAARITGLAVGTCSAYRWLASKVAPSERHPGLNLRCHQVVAKPLPDRQRYWLTLAYEERLSYQALEARIAAAAQLRERVRGESA